MTDVERFAIALKAALKRCSNKAVVQGDPLDSSYFDGELIHGVLLDGQFDMKAVAESLIADVQSVEIERLRNALGYVASFTAADLTTGFLAVADARAALMRGINHERHR
jgi:hypothetical protein